MLVGEFVKPTNILVGNFCIKNIISHNLKPFANGQNHQLLNKNKRTGPDKDAAVRKFAKIN